MTNTFQYGLYSSLVQTASYRPFKTEPVIPFAFKIESVADSRIAKVIECIFDELIGDTQALLRWFEFLASSIFFI